MASLPNTADYLVDRRQLRRKLFFWRAAGCVLVAAILTGTALYGTRSQSAGTLLPHVARYRITGLITGDQPTIDILKKIQDSQAAGVILDIDSPGGTTVGSERVYDAIREIAAKKPVVAEVNSLAASGAYIAALGADHIVARGNSLVGSIGVLFEFPNFSKLLDKVGIDVEKIKSAPLKAEPDGFTPTSDAARAAIASIVADSYGWFKDLVKDRRGLSDTELAAVDDGRVFTGRQGLPLKLIDEVGTEKTALDWLHGKGVKADLPVRDWKIESKSRWHLLGMAEGAARLVGADDLIPLMDAAFDHGGRGELDGLMAVWHGTPDR